MNRRSSQWFVFALALGVSAIVVTGGDILQPAASGTGPTQLSLEVTAIPCPAGYDNHQDDDVCFAYDGRIPGPTYVFHEGEQVEITVHNKIPDTIDNATSDPAVADDLRNARISLHRHGVITPTGEDGVAKPDSSPLDNDIVDSTIAAGSSHVYPFQTAFSGAWHYHDHTLLVSDAHHAVARGLFGSFVVLPAGVNDTNAYGLHMLNDGPVTGPEWATPAPAGERLDLIVTVLQDWTWEVELRDPNGDFVDEFHTGPGLAQGFTVDSAIAGDYTWTAQQQEFPQATYSGEVSVQ